jgi:hypothetical protein
MTSVVQARTQRDDLRPQRVWTLHKGEHAAAIDLKAMPGIGAEVVLTSTGVAQDAPVFRSHQQAELVSAIADPQATFEERVSVTTPAAQCAARNAQRLVSDVQLGQGEGVMVLACLLGSNGLGGGAFGSVGLAEAPQC